MDLCTGGQLNARDYSEDAICSIITQILRALVYLHDTRGICHRDVSTAVIADTVFSIQFQSVIHKAVVAVVC
jgi:serine/threonine protein kinase